MRALHFSYFNTVNVPLTFCKLYRSMGHEARLLTLYKHRGGFPEDICLHKKIFNPPWLKRIRVRREKEAGQAIQARPNGGIVHQYRPAGAFERLLLGVRDTFRELEFRRLAARYDLYGFDIYHFHGGIDFFRDARWVRRLAHHGKTIVTHYHGPDLRCRGVVAAIDRLSHCNITSEHDLLAFHPDLHYVALPYDCSPLKWRKPPNGRIRILHTPSVPEAKGTHLIEPVLRQLASQRDIEFAILTRVSNERVIREKQKSHILVEQVGNFGGTGYGVNSLEALGLGLTVVTEFTPEYQRFLTGHPFVLATGDTLLDTLRRLVDEREELEARGRQGRAWLEEHHGFGSVWDAFISCLSRRAPDTARRLRGG